MNCFECAFFQWWDGDYCCLDDLSLLFPSKNGYISKADAELIASGTCNNFKFSQNTKNIYGNLK